MQEFFWQNLSFFCTKICGCYETISNVTFGALLCTSSKTSSIAAQYSLKSSGNDKKPYICTLTAPLTIAEREQSEPAWKGIISAYFGLSSLQGVSLAASSAPKSAQNSILFRSQNFERTDFWLRKAKTEVILVGLPSILTQRKRKSVSQNRSSDYSLSVKRKAYAKPDCGFQIKVLCRAHSFVTFAPQFAHTF